jgi:ankyrin repeat protein
MELMLDAGANIDAADSKGLTPLHKACVSGKQPAAQLLVDCGASLEAACSRGYTALHHASQQGHLEVVQLLLDARASFTAVTSAGRTPLYLAAAAGHTAVVQLLVDSGAQPGIKDSKAWVALHPASQLGHTEVVQCLLAADSTAAHVDAQGPEGTPLHLACFKGHSEAAQLLIKAGADVDAVSAAHRSPLHQAVVGGGHSNVLEQLLAAGADPGLLTRTGASGLPLATMRGLTAIVQQLLVAMADVPGSMAVNAYYMGRTAVQWAVENGQNSCLEVLLAAGADPDKLYGAAAVGSGGRSIAGATALHRAVQLKRAEAVPLLATPANMQRVWQGDTPLHWALMDNQVSVAQALVTAGAPAGVKGPAGATPMVLAAIRVAPGLRALLPDMVRSECVRYQHLRDGQQQQEQGQQEEEPAAVLAAVLDGVFMLLVATAAGKLQETPDPLLGCFRAMLDVLGEAAAGDLLQKALSRAQAAPNPEAANAMGLTLHKMLVKAWLEELQPMLMQRWGMTNRLQALVPQPSQQQQQQRPQQPVPYNEQWALSQSALLAAQAATASAAGQWQVLVQLAEQLAGLHSANASAVTYLLDQGREGGGAEGAMGLCLELLKAWGAAQQQVAGRMQRELKEAVVGAVQAAQQQQQQQVEGGDEGGQTAGDG